MASPRRRAAKVNQNTTKEVTDEEKKKGSKVSTESPIKYCCLYFLLFVAILFGSLCVYVWLKECPYEPEDMALPPQPEFVGALEPNDVLSRGKRIFVNELIGPESFAADKDGILYTGTKDGRIWKIVDDRLIEVTRFRSGMICNDTSPPEVLEICSRPLGIWFHRDGLLYVADAFNGLYSVNVSDEVGESERKRLIWDINSNVVGADRVKLLNNMAFLKNGSIVMTDSSALFRLYSLRDEYLCLRPRGKLMMFTPGQGGASGRMFTLIDNLYFANGLLLSRDESHVLVPETAAARIKRYYLTGPKAGTWDTFASNLPGLPDNLSHSKRGTIWVPFANTRKHPLVDLMFRYTWIRKLVCKLDLDLQQTLAMLPGYGLIAELDADDGHIVRSYHDPWGEVVREATEVFELDGDNVYIGSYVAPYLVKVNLNPN